MEGYAYKLIPTEKIPRDSRMSCRYDLEDPLLRQSVSRQGILFPLVVTQKDYLIISGHRRFYALTEIASVASQPRNDVPKGTAKNAVIARRPQADEAISVPVLEIQKHLAEADAFLLSVFSNWNQNWNELDRVVTLAKAKNRYGVKEEELIRLWLPALGLSPEKFLLDAYLKINTLEDALKPLIHEDRLPFRAAHLLLDFSKEDQKIFALQLAGKLSLTTNQLVKSAPWLKDLCVLKKTGLEALLLETGLQKILEKPSGDLRQKTEVFLEALEQIRKPKLYEKRKLFQQRASQMQAHYRDLAIDLPEYFEAEGYTLRARIRRKDAVEGALKALQERKSDLISLFDIMLGCP